MEQQNLLDDMFFFSSYQLFWPELGDLFQSQSSTVLVEILETMCKLFVWRIVTLSNTCLQIIIIIYFKPYNCL